MKLTDFYEYKCVICGKDICLICPERWAYKYSKGKKSKTYYCCSWGCLTKIPGKNQSGRKADNRERIFSLLREGKTDREIMFLTGVTNGTVNYWKARYLEGVQ